MERVKKLNELKQQIQKSKTKNYIRYWVVEEGKPVVKSETEFAGDMTINFLYEKGGKGEIFKQFDLNQLANEQRKEVQNG